MTKTLVRCTCGIVPALLSWEGYTARDPHARTCAPEPVEVHVPDVAAPPVPVSLCACTACDDVHETRGEKSKATRALFTDLINRLSLEAGSNTPDFILAEYLVDALAAFDRATRARDAHYSIAPAPGRTLSEMAREGERNR